ncbi:30S ribosomal protein S7 [candidate division WWE3 bacterium RIFOXYC1_FULL_39_7]|uniref:Small ribosomal subunit protein uS7 n=2 Tax=Katanobacteria TaxID=422282 RepID=A0A1F4X482_UNCKA|nr:MAG: 30S ribosomal protein S7 [candidate division WWE3 bacterium RIFOXYC1_FULL_39_7]OGC76465.1 MAG: 30S ribosomal protein S7 [candidate division WWE3 bacterium RIFOXYD1_FULL_39_9]
MRSKQAKKRLTIADPVYKSKVVERLINIMMMHGKKTLARSIVYDSIQKLAEDRKEALRIFELAIKNVMPIQEVRSKRVGGATYQVPVPLKHDRAEALAMRWIVKIARNKSGRPMEERLHDEIKNASQNTGDAIKKKEDTHKMAEANRAFAHFARF